MKKGNHDSLISMSKVPVRRWDMGLLKNNSRVFVIVKMTYENMNEIVLLTEVEVTVRLI